MVIGELLASIGADITPLRKGLASAQKEIKTAQSQMVKSMNSGMARAGRSMQSAGKQMSMALTLPLAAAGAGAFKLANDFEASMSQITGLVGVAKDQVDEWGQDILKIAPELGKGPKELADALFFVTSAGIKGAEAMEVLEMSAKASAAGLGETKVIADLVTSAMNAYGSENLNAAQATDILVGSVREGKAPADALAGAMGQVLPLASEMKISFDQVGAAISAMTRTGTDASQASTQLKAIMSSLLKPTQQAEEALQGMGTSSAELRRSIREDGLIKTLGDVREMSSKFGEEALSTVFPNVRALSGVLDLMGSNAQNNIAVFESLADSTGSLNKAFAAASETGKFTWDQTVSAGKTALTALGGTIQEAFLPVLQTLTQKLTVLTDWFTGLSDSQKRLAVTIAGVVAAMGPALLIVGKLVSTIPALVGGFKMMVGVAKSAGIAMKALNSTMLANPYVAAAAAIIAVGTAIYALVKNTDLFSSAQSRATEAAQETRSEMMRETTEANSLFDRLKALESQTNLTAQQEKKRKELIKEINDQYGDYLPNQITEETNLRDIEAAQKAVTTALRETIIEKRKQQELNRIQNEALDTQQEAYDKIIKKLEKQGLSYKASEAIATKAMQGETNAAMELTEAFMEQEGIQNGVFNNTVQNVGKWAREVSKSMDTVETETDAVTKKFAALSQSTENGADMTVSGGVNMPGVEIPEIKMPEVDMSDFSEEYKNSLKLLQDASPTMDMVITPQVDIKDFKLGMDAMEGEVMDTAPRLSEAFQLETSIGVVANEMDDARIMAEGMGEAFDGAAKKQALLGQQIQRLIKDGYSPQSEAVRKLREDYQEEEKEIERTKQLTIDLGSMLTQVANDTFVQFGESLGDMFTGDAEAADFFQSLMGIVGGFIGQLGKALIAAGIGAISFKKLLANPWLAVAAGTALVALSAVVSNLLSSGPAGGGGSGGESSGGGEMSTVPALANGGLAYSPTLAMVGDNPRANSDPEVIAPLSKLGQYLGDSGEESIPKEVRLVANGDALEAVLRYRGKRLNNLR